jgi:hypothetical protein
MHIKRTACKSGRQLMNLPEYNSTRKLVHPGKGAAIERLIYKGAENPSEFMRREAAGSRIRQRYAEIDPDDARMERLKARITLPTVKGYWE